MTQHHLTHVYNLCNLSLHTDEGRLIGYDPNLVDENYTHYSQVTIYTCHSIAFHSMTFPNLERVYFFITHPISFYSNLFLYIKRDTIKLDCEI